MTRKVIVLVTLALAWAIAGTQASAQQGTPRAGEQIVQGTITAQGRDIFLWLEDELCVVQFLDYDFSPDLVVTDEAGKELASQPLDVLPGVVTMGGSGDDEHAEICTVPFVFSVPPSETYLVVLDPYFRSETLTTEDLASDLDIAVTRREGEPGPDFHDRPSGPIPGTSLYRIAGTLELRASTDLEDLAFMATPLGGCLTFGGYKDIDDGVQIAARDQTDTLIGVGRLEPIYTATDKCQFTFSIDVADATFYTLEMGRRGEIVYSKEDLQASDWHVDLVIGS